MSVLLNISCLKYKKTTVVTQILHNLMQRVFYILEFNHQCVSFTDMRFLMTCKVRSIYYIWTLTQFHNLCHQIINPAVQRMLLQNWSGFFFMFWQSLMWPCLHLVVNPPYLLWWSLLLTADFDCDTSTPWRVFFFWLEFVKGFSLRGSSDHPSLFLNIKEL